MNALGIIGNYVQRQADELLAIIYAGCPHWLEGADADLDVRPEIVNFLIHDERVDDCRNSRELVAAFRDRWEDER